MEEIIIEGQSRDIVSKGNLRKFRQKGLIPGIVYGAKEKSAPVFVEEEKFIKALHTKSGQNVLIKLKIGDKSKTVLLKEIQRDIITRKPIHIDFYAISLKEKVGVEVPLKVVGEAPGVKVSGGVLEHIIREVSVRCLPTQIPEAFTVDVSQLNIGDNVTVKDLSTPDNVEILTSSDSIVVHIVAPVAIEEEVPAEPTLETEPAEPEVISKGKKEAEGEEVVDTRKGEEKEVVDAQSVKSSKKPSEKEKK